MDCRRIRRSNGSPDYGAEGEAGGHRVTTRWCELEASHPTQHGSIIDTQKQQRCSIEVSYTRSIDTA
eukprot:12144283-Alexandrium_andersonii.AAC.1